MVPTDVLSPLMASDDQKQLAVCTTNSTSTENPAGMTESMRNPANALEPADRGLRKSHLPTKMGRPPERPEDEHQVTMVLQRGRAPLAYAARP